MSIETEDTRCVTLMFGRPVEGSGGPAVCVLNASGSKVEIVYHLVEQIGNLDTTWMSLGVHKYSELVSSLISVGRITFGDEFPDELANVCREMTDYLEAFSKERSRLDVLMAKSEPKDIDRLKGKLDNLERQNAHLRYELGKLGVVVDAST